MSYNYDFVRSDGTEVLVSYRLRGGGEDYFQDGHWMPGDPLEVEFEERVYGLPENEKLTQEEWSKIEKDILENPPDYDPIEEAL